jgi:hypothetical protein
VARRAAGTARAIAAHTAGTRLEPPVRKDRVDRGTVEPRRGDAVAGRVVQPVGPRPDRPLETGTRRRGEKAFLDEVEDDRGVAFGAEGVLGVAAASPPILQAHVPSQSLAAGATAVCASGPAGLT